MTFQDYFYTNGKSNPLAKSYEEQLLLNYEDAFEGNFAASLSSNKNFSLPIEDDSKSEYNENN